MMGQQETWDGVKIALSAIDEARFGVRTAKATDVRAAHVDALGAFCDGNRVELLVARCSTDDLGAAQAMERAGYILMDTLLYYSRDLLRSPIPDAPAVLVRPFRAGEEGQVRAVALEAFDDYRGHYHADVRLDRRACDEAYADWAVRSCVGDAADIVIVAESEGGVTGFLTVRLNSPEEGDVTLSGIARAAQGQGAHRALMIEALNWCKAQGARRTVTSTQVTNVASQKVWTRLGFEPHHSYYTFHKWFDRP